MGRKRFIEILIIYAFNNRKNQQNQQVRRKKMEGKKDKEEMENEWKVLTKRKRLPKQQEAPQKALG